MAARFAFIDSDNNVVVPSSPSGTELALLSDGTSSSPPPPPPPTDASPPAYDRMPTVPLFLQAPSVPPPVNVSAVQPLDAPPAYNRDGSLVIQTTPPTLTKAGSKSIFAKHVENMNPAQRALVSLAIGRSATDLIDEPVKFTSTGGGAVLPPPEAPPTMERQTSIFDRQRPPPRDRHNVACSARGCCPWWCFTPAFRTYCWGTLIQGALCGFYVGLCLAIKTTLWLAGGFAIGIGVCWIPCAVMICKGNRRGGEVGVVSLIALASGTFSGILGGYYLQDYYWYDALPVYYNVSAATPGDTIADQGVYHFLPGTFIDANVAGYTTYVVKGKYSTTTHYMCSAPILASDGLHQPYPQQTQFWVLGQDCCSNWGYSGQTCTSSEGWSVARTMGVTRKHSIHSGQGDVPGAIAAHYTGISNGTGLVVPMMSAYKVKLVFWTTPTLWADQQAARLTAGRIIVSIHAVLWPLWVLPLGLLIFILSIGKRR